VDGISFGKAEWKPSLENKIQKVGRKGDVMEICVFESFAATIATRIAGPGIKESGSDLHWTIVS
jgi:hypothetical protein